MHITRRTVSAAAILAVTASLAVGPAVLQPANAAPAAPERTSVTAECSAAQSALVEARAAQTSAHRQLVKARKALRKARHTHRAAAIRKAKRHLKHAKRRYAARTHEARVQAARVGYACSAPNSSAHAAGAGMKLDLLAMVAGEGGKVIDLATLKALLNSLVPGVADSLSTEQLTALLSGFNSGTPQPEALSILLGSAFTPTELAALLGGSPDPALVQRLVTNIVGDLAGMASLPVPSAPDTTTITGIITGLLGPLPAAPITTTTGGTGGTGLPVVGTVCLPNLLGVIICV